MRIIVEVGEKDSGVEYSLPLVRVRGKGGARVNTILEELNELEQAGTAPGELEFIPRCSSQATGQGGAGKENR